MLVISQNPKRRVSAIVVLVVLILVFYFVYDYVIRSYSPNPALLFLLFGFSIVLLLSPLLFETTKKPVAQESFTPPPVGTAEKPTRPIVRNCPKCKMLLPGSVWKCPNCGTTLPEGLGLEKDPTKLKRFGL